jgi:hypothetical protein
MRLTPGPQRRPGPNDRGSLSLLIIVVTAVVATVVVVVTRGTAGLVDLATLILSLSAIVVPLATGRKARRKE